MNELWDRIRSVQPLPGQGVVELMGVLAIALIAWPPAWRVTRQVVTIVHEGAHALVARLTGRSVRGVRLHADASGLTMSRGLPHGPGLVATLAAGYVGPALLGLLGAFILGRGHAYGLLCLLLLIVALLVLLIRNWFGLLALLLAGGVLLVILWFLPGEVQTAFGYLVMWFLLLAAPWTVWELQRTRRSGRGYDSDADQLGRLTRTPGGLWVFVFGIVTLAALVIGAGMMVERLSWL